MINKLLLAFAAVLMMASNSSYATLVAGDVVFNGGLATTDTGDLATANSVTFLPGATVAGGTGSFSSATGDVTWNIGTLDLTNTNPNALFASFDIFSFFMESFTITRSTSITGFDSIIINGQGKFSGTGFQTSGGFFNITLQEPGIPNGSQALQFSFSSAAHSIPEPTTLAMLGLGLAGLGIARKRASK